MFTNLGVLVTVVLLAAPQQAAAGSAVNEELKLQRDGSLSVTETITAERQLVRRVPLRVPEQAGEERVFTVRDVSAEGGTAEVSGEQLVITVPGGTTTVTYTVDGAVADVGGQQQVRWQTAGGWDADLAMVRASFIAPVLSSSTDCLAGPAGSSGRCTFAEVDHTGVVRIEQDVLNAGERVELVVGLPAGTVPANARFEQVLSAFSLSLVTGLGFGVLALLVLAGAFWLWWVRRRDASALRRGGAPVEVLVRDGDRVSFASPDGVLPGQVGTVVDGTVDVVDVSATVVDLAVRNYLWLAEVPGPDWRLSRRNPPDEQLLEFERVVFDALLAGRDGVLLSELRVDLRPVREAMYADVVRRRWFSRHPGAFPRGLLWAGAAIAGLGALATVVLAFTVGYALLGVAVILAGAALAAGAPWLPARTGRGLTVAGQIGGVLRYLRTVSAAELPAGDRELVFSRSLPYAVVLGETDRWLRAFADLDPDADGSAGVYWYGGLDGDGDLHRFAERFAAFLTTLDGVLAEADRRALLPA